nr:RNA-directed DNA polymerase, eukaryota, reverse transcriptase zinc-binding domain protein [Tanacetum cinerariifolium]
EKQKEDKVYEREDCHVSPIQKVYPQDAQFKDMGPCIGESSCEFSTSVHARKSLNGGSILDVLDDIIKSIFKKEGVSISDNFIALYGTWLPTNTKILIVVIYAPQSAVLKRILWEYISDLINRWNGETLVLGDFNEVRSEDERFGSIFNPLCARTFNHFISSSRLLDVKMEGYSFTWSHPSASKMSMLDRFLVSDGIFSIFPTITADCGENKSHGPDGFTFEFFKHFWDLISSDLCAAVTCFFDNGSFPRGCNSSFIALIPKVSDAKFVTDFQPISLIGCVYKVITKILANRLSTVISDLVSNTQFAFIKNRQILDGPFILNEALAWCKRKKKQALMFKVDFAKAYDSVRWDFLLDALHAFGFSSRWCSWIRGIFSSNMASILVNGSPTNEFLISHGLKQGDPLAPMLFILVMESLHISVTNAVNDGIFKGLHIHDSLVLSHLFYADDAVFVGEWSDDNLANLKVRARLSKWKANTLSIGRRLTLLKSVLGSVSLYSMSIYKVPKGVLHELEMIQNDFFIGVDSSNRKINWVAWDKVLASKKHGDLGVSSYFAFNCALLLKWVWRFLSQDCSLWSQVVSVIYRSSFESHTYNFSSCWISILREVHILSLKGFNFLSHCKIRVGNGLNTIFWLDNWILDLPLSLRFPRIFALERDKTVLVTVKRGASSLNASFRRQVRDGVKSHQWSEFLSLIGSFIFSPSSDR